LKVLSKTGQAKEMAYAEIAKGGTVRDETKIVTIAVSHVSTSRRSGTMRTSTARDMPITSKNMITGAAQMDGAILV